MSKCTVLAAFLACGGLAAAGAGPTVKEVMEATHKGKESLAAKIRDGKGSEEDHKKLLEAYTALGAQKPPQGDAKAWKEKTDTAIAALTELVEKKAGALDKVKTATTCKACHDVFKPKKPQ